MALSTSMKENDISIGERLDFLEYTDAQFSASTFSLSEATLNRLFLLTSNRNPAFIPKEQTWIYVSQAHANNQP